MVKRFIAYNQCIINQSGDSNFGTLLQASFDNFRSSSLKKVTSQATNLLHHIAHFNPNLYVISCMFRRAIKKDRSILLHMALVVLQADSAQ